MAEMGHVANSLVARRILKMLIGAFMSKNEGFTLKYGGFEGGPFELIGGVLYRYSMPIVRIGVSHRVDGGSRIKKMPGQVAEDARKYQCTILPDMYRT